MGKIDYLAYNLKPQSKRIDTKELTELLSDFLETYQSSVYSSNDKIFYYGSASYLTKKVNVLRR